MIEYISGNILDAQTDVIVCPVNTVGVMGAGLAKQIKAAFPEAVAFYEDSCRNSTFSIGTILEVPLLRTKPSWIFHFPTKRHWRQPSQLSYIEEGLQTLARICELNQGDFTSLALPALGCGLGGLRLEDVKGLIEGILGSVTNVSIVVYLPQ